MEVMDCTDEWDSGRASIGIALAGRLLALATLRRCDSFD